MKVLKVLRNIYKVVKMTLCSHEWEYEIDLTTGEFKRVCRHCEYCDK